MRPLDLKNRFDLRFVLVQNLQGNSPVIVVRIKEGLGNQMFQYATGFALSLQKRTHFFFDNSIYFGENWYTRHKTPRQFALGDFTLTAKPLSGWRRFVVLQLIRKRYTPVRLLLRSLGIPFALRVVSDFEQERIVDKRLQRLGESLFLDGYWQTEEYFKQHRDTILKEFTFRKPPDALNSVFLARIASSHSVCVHIRRADYTTPESLSIRGLCGLEYYRKALAHIEKRVSDPHFFVFSDDPEWVKGHFPLSNSTTLVTHNLGQKDTEDLRLMTNCKHFIIANSSFSWWAAWLGRYPQKIVVAPREWMANGDDGEIIPEDWIRL